MLFVKYLNNYFHCCFTKNLIIWNDTVIHVISPPPPYILHLFKQTLCFSNKLLSLIPTPGVLINVKPIRKTIQIIVTITIIPKERNFKIKVHMMKSLFSEFAQRWLTCLSIQREATFGKIS